MSKRSIESFGNGMLGGVLIALASFSHLACGGDDDGAAVIPAAQAEFAERGPFAVASMDLEFVDTSRTTAANRDFGGAAERRLAVRVWYPVDAGLAGTESPAPASGGPFPLLGYAHGFTSGRGGAAPVGEHLVSHGYVVIAPDFPLSWGGAPGGPVASDIANQPGDLGFVMQSLIGLEHPVAAAIDAERQGIFGLSLGGATVVVSAFHPRLGLDFIDAAVALAPATCFAGPDFYGDPPPIMIVGATADELVPFDESPERTFGTAPGPQTLVALDGGTHVGMLGIGVADATNTDLVVGCPQVESLVDEAVFSGTFEPSASLFVEGLSGDVYRPEGCDTDRFCDNGYVQTMSAERQVELVRIATLAHFEATLRGRADAQAFIERRLAVDNSDVEVRRK